MNSDTLFLEAIIDQLDFLKKTVIFQSIKNQNKKDLQLFTAKLKEKKAWS